MENDLFYRIRESIHQNPELSGEEIHTSTLIFKTLQQYCPTNIYTSIGGYGVIAEYHFLNPGPTLLFRADMDAVAIQENQGLSYSSRNTGISHKCGHDGHTAVLLAFARLLHQHPLQYGRILLLFQPAEENGQGARAILQDPWFKQQKIDKAFALHNLPGYPLHTIVCRPGGFTCSVISCTITLTGQTSHAAEPEKANSPVSALLDILHKTTDWNQGRINSPDFFRTTLIELHIGEEAYGVTAGNGLLRLTLRATTEANLQQRIKQLEKLVNLQKQIFQTHIEWIEPFAANENDPIAVQLIQEAAYSQQLNYQGSPYPFAWGEDFGLFTQSIPGAMFGLGAGVDTPPLHTPEYDFPNEIIETGAKLFYEIARKA